jgi:hypothetical protein
VRADRYVSLGDDYIEIREMITEVCLGRNITELGELLQVDILFTMWNIARLNYNKPFMTTTMVHMNYPGTF